MSEIIEISEKQRQKRMDEWLREEEIARPIVDEMFRRCIAEEEVGEYVLFDVLLHAIRKQCHDPYKDDDDINAHREVMSELLMGFIRENLDNTTLGDILDKHEGTEVE